MRWLVGFASLIVPATGLSGVVHALDWQKLPPPPPPIHDPGRLEPIFVPLDKDFERKDLGDCGEPICPDHAELARPLSPLESLFADRDYPAGARHDRHTGIVYVSLEVGVRGRVTRCRISQAREIGPLEHATCAILIARARFRPARDRKGVVIIGTHFSMIPWRLPS